MENSLRQALLYSRGDFAVFIGRPISAVLLATALAILIGPPFVRWLRRQGGRPGLPGGRT
jgi:TctA family transporter